MSNQETNSEQHTRQAHELSNHENSQRNQNSSGCFPAGTLVETPTGAIPIEKLAKGDSVLGVSIKAHEKRTKRIAKVCVHPLTTIWQIGLTDGRTIRTTAAHSFYNGRSWIIAKNLKAGDSILFLSKAGIFESIEIRSSTPTVDRVPVFNLVIEEDFTFIADGAVAHSFSYFRNIRSFYWRLFSLTRKSMAGIESKPQIRQPKFGFIGLRKLYSCSANPTIARQTALSLLLVSGLVFLVGCDAETQRAIEAASSKAKGEISNLKGGHDMGLFNEEPDYGVRVSFTLTNTGEDGSVTVSPWISCSEGEWSKSQTLTMTSGQSMYLTYLFEQPTVNSTNIQYGVKYFPQ